MCSIAIEQISKIHQIMRKKIVTISIYKLFCRNLDYQVNTYLYKILYINNM